MPMNPPDPSTLATDANQDPLAQLQDIHLPPEIGLWPPAWGWWLFALVLALAISALLWMIKRNRARNAYRALALVELDKLNQQFSTEQNAEYLQALSILLRRTALSGFGRFFNASLKGKDWLEWMDNQCAKTQDQFSQGAGTAFLIGPYQKNPEFNRAALHNLSVLWIREHRNQWQKPAKTARVKEDQNHV